VKEKIESKGEDKVLASSSRNQLRFWLRHQEINFAFGFVVKKSTSLDSEVDKKQEMTKSKRASSLKKRRLNVKKVAESGRNDHFALAVKKGCKYFSQG
jgi:hypothetical protein